MRWFVRLLLPFLYRLQPLMLRLRSWQLITVVAALTLLNWIVPDPIPFLDEILMTIVLILLARWRAKKQEPFEGESAPPSVRSRPEGPFQSPPRS